MIVVERLAGTFLVRGEGRFAIVGQPKSPCDWAAHGFERPVAIDAPGARRAELVCHAEPTLPGPRLRIGRSFDAALDALESKMLVARNGSASERLFTMVLDVDDPDDVEPDHEVDATWLVDIPERAFAVIRDSVLRCT